MQELYQCLQNPEGPPTYYRPRLGCEKQLLSPHHRTIILRASKQDLREIIDKAACSWINPQSQSLTLQKVLGDTSATAMTSSSPVFGKPPMSHLLCLRANDKSNIPGHFGGILFFFLPICWATFSCRHDPLGFWYHRVKQLRKNDVLSAFHQRWVHSFNTAAPGHVVEAGPGIFWEVGSCCYPYLLMQYRPLMGIILRSFFSFLIWIFLYLCHIMIQLAFRWYIKSRPCYAVKR